jgi:regulation of enolase protein 1 (concanavalin A-like superfamily)
MSRCFRLVLVCVFTTAVAGRIDSKPGPDSSWETVTSKEGGFTVEMPSKPNLSASRTRKGSGGTVKVLMIGCNTPSGTYLAFRVDYPTAIVKEAEDAELDAERDEFAKRWNGRVISEKKVRAGDRVGRDFTVRGKPKGEPGLLTVRIRQYLVGKAVVAVAVVSAPNCELPDDTGRFLGSLALGKEKTRAAGTPEPEPAGKKLPGWGLAIDPDKDCKFVPEAKAIALEVPGTLHDLHPDTAVLNAPRVMRAVEGDFLVTVKVTGAFQPGGKSTNPKGVPYNGAGILIWSDSDNFIRLERGALLRGGKVITVVAFEEREGGARGAVHNELFKAGTSYLRLQRKGSRILGAVSTDGTNWKNLQPIDTVWPANLKVGLAAINSSSETFAVRFEEFTLKAKEPAGKGSDSK